MPFRLWTRKGLGLGCRSPTRKGILRGTYWDSRAVDIGLLSVTREEYYAALWHFDCGIMTVQRNLCIYLQLSNFNW